MFQAWLVCGAVISSTGVWLNSLEENAVLSVIEVFFAASLRWYLVSRLDHCSDWALKSVA